MTLCYITAVFGTEAQQAATDQTLSVCLKGEENSNFFKIVKLKKVHGSWSPASPSTAIPLPISSTADLLLYLLCL